jgi:hypothetical protein
MALSHVAMILPVYIFTLPAPAKASLAGGRNGMFSEPIDMAISWHG